MSNLVAANSDASAGQSMLRNEDASGVATKLVLHVQEGTPQGWVSGNSAHRSDTRFLTHQFLAPSLIRESESDMPVDCVTHRLSKGWQFKQTDTEKWFPVAQVPTNVHLDLMNNQKYIFDRLMKGA